MNIRVLYPSMLAVRSIYILFLKTGKVKNERLGSFEHFIVLQYKNKIPRNIYCRIYPLLLSLQIEDLQPGETRVVSKVINLK